MSSGSRLLNSRSASSLKSQSVSINGIRELSDLEQSYRKDLFTETAGLVASHGEPWYEVRSKVQQDMMRPKSAMYYINDIEEISQQLVDLMTANVDSEGEVEDIVKHIQCWSLESTAAIFLDTRLGVLDPNLPEDSEGRRFIRAVNVFLGPDFNDLNMGLPIWKYVPGPGLQEVGQVAAHHLPDHQEVRGRRPGEIPAAAGGEGGEGAERAGEDDSQVR